MLADRGVIAVVFEQNQRPYGKIEDGLPRWHEALREKEYETIDAKLSRPGIQFIPNTKRPTMIRVAPITMKTFFIS